MEKSPKNKLMIECGLTRITLGLSHSQPLEASLPHGRQRLPLLPLPLPLVSCPVAGQQFWVCRCMMPFRTPSHSKVAAQSQRPPNRLQLGQPGPLEHRYHKVQLLVTSVPWPPLAKCMSSFENQQNPTCQASLCIDGTAQEMG